jgi:Right handed beta helix region
MSVSAAVRGEAACLVRGLRGRSTPADDRPVVASVLAALVLSGTTGGPVLAVSQAAGCTQAPTRDALVAGSFACTISAAQKVALPGDTVSVAAGAYPPTRISASGTETAPIAVSAVPGTVTIDAGQTPNALGIIGVHDAAITGLALTGGSAQAVWIGSSQRVTLADVAAGGSATHGIQVNNSQDVVIDSSQITANQSAGIMETGADSGDVFSNDTVSGNGTGGPRYLGSGIEVGGSGTRITGCTITGNGVSKLYEHGVYVASVATGWSITGSTISGSSGADVKAAGSNGTISSSTLGPARLGIYARGDGITISQVQVKGSFRDGLVVAGGSTLLSHSVVSNDGVGYGKAARAAYVYGGGRLTLAASQLYLRGVRVKPTHGA